MNDENEVPDSTNLLTTLQRGAIGRSGKVWLSHRRLMATVYLVLLFAITLFAIARYDPSEHRTRTTGLAVPKGLQPVSFHGLQVFVPASWRFNSYDRCGVPASNTVLLPGGPSAFVGCQPMPSSASFTVVQLLTADSDEGRAQATVATKSVTVDGHAGRRGVGTPNGHDRELAVLVLPDPGVVVSVASPDATTAARILDSTRVVQLDSFGCADHVNPLAPGGASDRPGTARQLVPGDPTSAAICRYSGNWLARSIRLTSEQIGGLRTILNDLPPGVSQPGPGVSATEDACLEEAGRGFVARFGYESGPDLDVYVHISSCADLSASNGSRTTKINEALVTFLTRVAEYDSGFPDPRELR